MAGILAIPPPAVNAAVSCYRLRTVRERAKKPHAQRTMVAPVAVFQ
jgi:hypothetical protein